MDTGHPTPEESVSAIALFYSWPSMDDDLRRHIGTCRTCGSMKNGPEKQKVLPRTYLQDRRSRSKGDVNRRQRSRASTGMSPKTITRRASLVLEPEQSPRSWGRTKGHSSPMTNFVSSNTPKSGLRREGVCYPTNN
ncbi:hypothetical protein Zmor_000630 [Zophobas morio]|uniref:Integrase zinc-binding domain-containing protein n=1 Tax=Zophobas morio TaxID=2755281 RepID=A0AA38IWV2_9CUCU|nr:hypothetical protein Zmor_000630 [Zophobas morio]